MVDATEPNKNEGTLAALRNRLEFVHTSLTTIQSVLIATCEYLDVKSPGNRSGVAHVLMKCASSPLEDELNELSSIIESIGGSASSSDDPEEGAQ